MEKLVFTGVIFQDGEDYLSLCPELDLMSQGETPAEAKAMLLEAASLYLESAFETGLPYLRPIPQDADPRLSTPEAVRDIFRLKVEIGVRVYA